jgi:hypothetical protein
MPVSRQYPAFLLLHSSAVMHKSLVNFFRYADELLDLLRRDDAFSEEEREMLRRYLDVLREKFMGPHRQNPAD